MELIIIFVAITTVWTSQSLKAHAQVSLDQSVIFSFLKEKSNSNNPLLTKVNTTTIIARTDQMVSSALAQSPLGVVLTSTQYQNIKGSDTVDPTTIQENVIVKTNPADSQSMLNHGRTIYQVATGDSIVSIASNFGISPHTIMLENKLNETSVLKVGQQLTILPTTGLTHIVAANDTLESITKKYKISEDDLLDANELEVFDDVSVGEALVIPQQSVSLPVKLAPKIVKNDSGKVTLKTATAPSNLIGGISFIWPTAVHAITQGFSKRHSGLDISNSKMVPIYAAEDGFVEISGFQAGGYGNTIVINHSNGFKTRYAHTSEIYVSAGDKVTKGQTIAKQGRTGRVRGATGIHLHFEIIKNGAKVNPLSYVRP